jgi:hypothetical protein
MGSKDRVIGIVPAVNTEGIPWRLRVGVSVLTAVSGDAAGSHVTPYASLWLPLSRTVFVGLGSGFTWSGDSSRGSGSASLPRVLRRADYRCSHRALACGSSTPGQHSSCS